MNATPSATDNSTQLRSAEGGKTCTWTPKVCKIMAFMAIFLGLGLLFYILWGFRWRFPTVSGFRVFANYETLDPKPWERIVVDSNPKYNPYITLDVDP